MSFSLPDTGDYRTPNSVLAARKLKEQLLNKKIGKGKGGPKPAAIEFNSDFMPEENPTVDLALEEISEIHYAETDEDHPFRPAPRFSSPVQAVSAYLESMPAREDVQIVTGFGKLGFRALSVTVTDAALAFIVKKESLQFEPEFNTNLKVIYKGQTYSVVYAGGSFSFPEMPFTFITFLKVEEDNRND